MDIKKFNDYTSSNYKDLFSPEEIKDYFDTIVDQFDASTFTFVGDSHVSVIIFIPEISKEFSKVLTECFYRLRLATDLVTYDKRDKDIKEKNKSYHMVSRQLKIK